jgi:hypothetical protein
MSIEFQSENLLWATDDGSYGSGKVVLVDTSKWSKKQWQLFNDLADSGDVYAQDLAEIDNNKKAKFD